MHLFVFCFFRLYFPFVPIYPNHNPDEFCPLNYYKNDCFNTCNIGYHGVTIIIVKMINIIFIICLFCNPL